MFEGGVKWIVFGGFLAFASVGWVRVALTGEAADEGQTGSSWRRKHLGIFSRLHHREQS